MNGIYDIFVLDSDGIRDDMVCKYEKLDGELNWSKNSRFLIIGTCIGDVPVAIADRIAISRNGTQIFSGVVTEMNTECEDTENDIRTWEAVVVGDNVVLSWRYALPCGIGADPSQIVVDEDVYDKRPNDNDETNLEHAASRMVYYARKHAGMYAHASRKLLSMSEEIDFDLGTEGRSAYHIKRLSDIISEIGDPDGLYPNIQTNMEGVRVLKVPASRVMPADLVVSPEFGNAASWKKSESFPEFNAIWVISGLTKQQNEDDTITETRVWVYAEDVDSIAKYGRIESVITKSDIKVVYANPDKPDIVPVTEAEVTQLLEDEADRQLRESAGRLKWTVMMLENNQCAFMDDWKLGDKVRCVVGGESFDSIIETVQITYAEGIETVTPIIGEVENGLYGDLFKMLNGIDRRLKAKEEN